MSKNFYGEELMKPMPHQELLINKCLDILKKHNMCYLAAEERVGKTLTALYIAKRMRCVSILIITKKRAISGWKDTLEASKIGVNMFVKIVNPEVIVSSKAAFADVKSQNYDLVIIDEAHHAFGAYPRVSKTARKVQEIVYSTPILFCSATPCAESYSQLFHQLNLSRYSPWACYPNFYRWFDDYGIPETQFISGMQIKKYNKTKTELFDSVFKEYFVFMSRKEAGFEHHPEDILHYVELNSLTMSRYKELEKTGCIKEWDYLATNAAHVVTALHQLEGGTLKRPDMRGLLPKNPYETGKNESSEAVIIGCSGEKVDYILENFGDTEDVVIFYNYKAEEILLRRCFKKARILQGTSFAEGVDLSNYKTLIVYSMNFSASKYIQRRARQCNIRRGEPIKVHFLLCKGLVSEAVYESVALKNQNFTAKLFQSMV